MMLTEITLLTTFALEKRDGIANITCQGCRELIELDGGVPGYIRGVIRFRGESIPVIDFAAQYCGDYTDINNSSCVLIIPHRYDDKVLNTAVLLQNFDEIMKLSCGDVVKISLDSSANLHFFAELARSSRSDEILFEYHDALRQVRCNGLENFGLQVYQQVPA